LRALTRFFSNDQFDFEVQLVLARDEVPGCVVGADEGATQPLGWSTWIRSAPFERDADEAVFTL
jgi:type VI secretion system protein ImpH